MLFNNKNMLLKIKMLLTLCFYLKCMTGGKYKSLRIMFKGNDKVIKLFEYIVFD